LSVVVQDVIEWSYHTYGERLPEEGMEERRITRYIACGSTLRYLRDAQPGWPLHGRAFILSNIDQLVGFLKEFELRVTLRASKKLLALKEKLEARPKGATLTKDEASALRSLVYDLEKTLFAEAEEKTVFVVGGKRVDVRKLLVAPEALLAPNVFSSLPEIAQYDFRQAGKCIAFNVPTAAAFHLLRGTESVLRHLYCCVVKRRRVKPLLWSNMVKHLRNRRSRPEEALLATLDSIREFHRNPTSHPEKRYDSDEVQDLLGLCIEIANRSVASKWWTIPAG